MHKSVSDLFFIWNDLRDYALTEGTLIQKRDAFTENLFT